MLTLLLIATIHRHVVLFYLNKIANLILDQRKQGLKGIEGHPRNRKTITPNTGPVIKLSFA